MVTASSSPKSTDSLFLLRSRLDQLAEPKNRHTVNGNANAYSRGVRFRSIGVRLNAVVVKALIVSVDDAAWFAPKLTDAGLSKHVGALAEAGCTEHIRLTVSVNPFTDNKLTPVAVDPPV